MKPASENAPAFVLQVTQRIVAALVNRPEVVRITSTAGESAVIIEITAGRPEVGQIIGRAGRNIQALKDILMAVGAKHGLACQVVVMDERG
jgi:predicted RNA-binding protein YlqC (UPF0109 family)